MGQQCSRLSIIVFGFGRDTLHLGERYWHGWGWKILLAEDETSLEEWMPQVSVASRVPDETQDVGPQPFQSG